jgi:hypothetical protein
MVLYCRYREVSPICVGKNRCLFAHEATKEHLIPKSLLRNPRIKAALHVTFNSSDAPNVDISCYRCNHLKNNTADVPFVWKLQYFSRNGISLKSKTKLLRSITFTKEMTVDKKRLDEIGKCLYHGQIQVLGKEGCILTLNGIRITLQGNCVMEVQCPDKLPRKLKKRMKLSLA